MTESKNYIHTLQMDNNLVVTQGEKHQAIYDHYLKHIGSYVPRSCSLNSSNL
jgi:hypothetical protein